MGMGVGVGVGVGMGMGMCMVWYVCIYLCIHVYIYICICIYIPKNEWLMHIFHCHFIGIYRLILKWTCENVVPILMDWVLLPRVQFATVFGPKI